MEKSISILDKDYSWWISELSSRYRRSQIKAAVKVNEVMILFYLELGRDIVLLDAENKYGSAFYASLSRDLKHALPDASGLSESNIRYAKRFYVLYSEAIGNFQQVAEKFDLVFAQNVITDLCLVPWGHHIAVIDKAKGNMKKALFFVHQTVQNGWSRNMLLNFLGTDLYERQGKALTNFERTLPNESLEISKTDE